MKHLYHLLIFLSVLITKETIAQNSNQIYALGYTNVYIDSVHLNGNAGNTIDWGSDCNATAAFTNANMQVAHISVGASYTLDLGVDICNGTFSTSNLQAWIDYNDDGFFQSSESCGNLSVDTISLNSISFVIPSGINSGLRSMRVILDKGNSSTNPNANINVGAIINFPVMVEGGFCEPMLDVFLSASTTTDLMFDFIQGAVSSMAFATSQEVGTSIIDTTAVTSNTSIDIVQLQPNTLYEVCIYSICATGDTSLATCMYAATSNLPIAQSYTSSGCLGFLDISNTGTNLNLTNSQTTGLSLPFSYGFQGQLINDITVGHDGAVILGTQTGTVGYDMASSTQNGFFVFNQALSAYANGAPVGGVYYQTIGTSPNRKFIVQWDDIGYVVSAVGNTDRGTFQLVLDEATNNAYFIYDDVDFSNVNFDYGRDAEIGVRGPLQNLDISLNDTLYLQSHSCVQLTDGMCDTIVSINKHIISEDQIELSWWSDAQQVNIEYGLTGFTPGTGNTVTGSGTGSHMFTVGTNGILLDNTYDVYVRSECSMGMNSVFGPAMMDSITFKGCTDPVFVDVTASYDSLFITYSNSNSVNSVSMITKYRKVGDPFYTIISHASSPLVTYTQVIDDNSLMGPGLIEVCALRECYVPSLNIADTSDWVCIPTPVPTNIIINTNPSTSTNVLVNAIAYNYSNQGANTSSNTSQLASMITTGSGNNNWVNGSANNAMWFNFVAPGSGSVIIDATGIDHLNKSFDPIEGIANKMALYSTTDVNDPNQFTLVSVNDNSVFDTTLLSADWVVCGLTPGTTYYLLYSDDESSYNGGAFTLQLTDPDVLDDIQVITNPAICLNQPSVSMHTMLTSFPNNDGIWSTNDVTVQSHLIENELNLLGLQEGITSFTYMGNLDCASDTVNVDVYLENEPSAGISGSINAYLNCPVNLFSGLSGSLSLGGTWYNPQGNVINASIISSGSIPGQYNFTYIVEGEACDNDTSMVVLIVDASYNCSAGLDALETSIKLWPNPATERFNLFVANSGDELKYRIFDTKGCGLQGEYHRLPSNEIVEVDVQDLSPGVYFIEITNGAQSSIQRLVIE